ncbi:hypothetical protein H0H92_003416 [Tricholoma furcatifolium]|nr:hypothetical protein H0H92_003416 [Tricholoma furcatifolium]
MKLVGAETPAIPGEATLSAAEIGQHPPVMSDLPFESELPSFLSSSMETTSSEYYQTSSSYASSDTTYGPSSSTPHGYSASSAWPPAGPTSVVHPASHFNPLSPEYAGKRSIKPIPLHKAPLLRMQSYRILNDHCSMNIPTLDHHITTNLNLHTSKLKSADLASLFSKAYSSLSVARDIISEAPDLFPDGGLLHVGLLTKIGAAAYLNDIVKCAVLYARKGLTPMELEPLRYWSAELHDHPLQAGPWKCKPGVSLLPLVDDKPIKESAVTWADIAATVEVTSAQLHADTIKETIQVKPFVMKYVQGDFVWALSMAMNATNFRVFLVDHQGMLEFGPLSYKDDAKLFVTIILALAVTPTIGRDDSFERRIPEKDDTRPLFTPSKEVTFESRPKFVPLLKNEDLQDVDDSHVSGKKRLRHDGTGESSNKRKKSCTLWKSKSADVLGASKVILDCNLQFVMHDKVQYQVMQELFTSQTIIGRATRVWRIATMPDTKGKRKHYIMKDSFVHCQRPMEALFIIGLDCPQIPKVIGYGRRKSTADTRPFNLVEEHHHYWECRRTITSPVCIRLPEIHSFVELISAFLDYTKAIRYLKINNLMHRDISSANVMLSEEPFSLEDFKDDKRYQIGQLEPDVINHLVAHKYRRGILIDYDHAALIDENLFKESKNKNPASDDNVNDRRGLEPTSTIAHVTPTESSAKTVPVATSCRTGTPPFMAIPLLLEPQRHIVAFDLESLFYVLLFIISYLSEPGIIQSSSLADTPSAAQDLGEDSVLLWFKSKGSFLELAHRKRSQLFTAWRAFMQSSISPYFTFLKPYMLELWLALYPRTAELTAGTRLPEDCTDRFIQIFVDALTVAVRNETHYAKQWDEYKETLAAAEANGDHYFPEFKPKII